MDRLVFGVLALLAFAGCTRREDTFYIQDAALSDSRFLDRLQQVSPRERHRPDTPRSVAAHRIGTGAGTIYAYRSYDGGSPNIIDDEHFLKLTVWSESPAAGAFPLEAQGEHLIVVYTRGGSAWPDSACSGYVTGGSLAVVRDGDEVRVHVRGTLQARASEMRTNCQGRPIDIEFVTRPLPLDRLTPWLGAASDHVYRETYPRGG
jgi:hypothetical protein